MASPRSPSLTESDPDVLSELIDEEEDKLVKLEQRVTKSKRLISRAEAKLEQVKEKKRTRRHAAHEEERKEEERKRRLNEGKLPKSGSAKILKTKEEIDAEMAAPSQSEAERARLKKESDDKAIAEMQEEQRLRNQERSQRESAERSGGGAHSLDQANARAEELDKVRLENENRFHQRESRRAEGSGNKGGMTKGGGKGKDADYKGGHKGYTRRMPPPRTPLPSEPNEVTTESVRSDMDNDDLIDIATIFDGGYRRRNPSVEEKFLDIAEVYRTHGSVTLSDVYLHLYNPGRGNFAYGWEDNVGDTHFLNQREVWNNAHDLRRGTEYYGMLPREPQKLCDIVDRYNGFNKETTSCLLIRKIGNPSFGLGYRNEEDWAPRILTCLGLFPFGNYAVVASAYTYYYPSPSIANEACFIGEMRITLASRDLAEFYMHVLSGEYHDEGICVNENRKPISVAYSGYALTGKDMTERVDCARIDKDIWIFPVQFDPSGNFLTNGPNATQTKDSPFVI